MIWERSLPQSMRMSSSCSAENAFYISMLHLAYNNLLILLYRTAYTKSDGESEDGRIAFKQPATTQELLKTCSPVAPSVTANFT